ncbi:metal ABC transporter solute-binding protein, Zn/Mn family [Mycolicibacterium sphagni]|uniref:ABC transporter substrate-binding protein n=1 Tax=Mycolicibacterium sphagni TaxID=1786 RepID=A0A255DFN9_9MYCO|nr:zinc ABC transporter substrate-binding protein [Mycolicibacterium sphagni]MCV7174586.1 zinc ABC transporter substrate-binding protein [Mycolicibacterium sphagni]OYN76055.1 ABC transporter substrate-binding protein [Mycolicibacterium sphagni]
MTPSSYRLRGAAAALFIVPLGLAACSSHPASAPSATSSATSASSSATAAPATGGTAAPAACPTTPVNVVVSVDQWGDIVSELAGKCGNVKTILASSSVDPHDYEPSPSDGAAFTGAQLVVVNGADYDPWASKLAATSAPNAPVVDAGKVTNTAEGGNPHLWYNPSAVTAVADAVTAALTKLEPKASDYFTTQRASFTTALKPYDDLIAKIKAGASGKSYAATETVFDYQAQALGLVNKTPAGYMTASANETDPTPADIAAFTQALSNRQIDVLIYNTQTEGSIPQQIRDAATKAGVPVVDVTETVPPGQTSFEGWQDGQLTALAKALGVAV